MRVVLDTGILLVTGDKRDLLALKKVEKTRVVTARALVKKLGAVR